MSATLICNGCGTKVQVPDGHTKLKLRCPECGVLCEVPEAAQGKPARPVSSGPAKKPPASAVCSPFPGPARCEGEDRVFCNMWRTAAFLMNFVVVVELATIAGFVVIGSGGKVKRQDGWKVLGSMLVVVAVIQFATMGVVVSRLTPPLLPYPINTPSPEQTYRSANTLGEEGRG